jgi:hypothetical protein
MLLQVYNYLKQAHIASNQQMARALRMEVTALQPLLDFWLNKGAFHALEEKKECNTSCLGCHKERILYYEYVNN